jgi:hypothetical protein
MTTALQEPFRFVVEALTARGALVEEGDGGALALLPEEVARALGVAAELRLARAGSAEPGASACALGAPLVDAIIADARGRAPLAQAALSMPAPRPSQASSLAARFVVRNGLCEPLEVFPVRATYVSAFVSFVAEADDRYEGLLHLVVDARDLGVPGEPLARLLDPRTGTSELETSPAAPIDLAPALTRITRSARPLGDARVAPFAASVERRHRRDHERVSAYFASLVAEARSPRRRQDPAAIEAKVAHLVAERDAKLAALEARFAVRTRLAFAGLLVASVAAIDVRMRVRRRKAEGEIVLRLPAGSQAFDALACAGCSGATSRPAFCDDRMHVLCEECLPNAQGRPDCRACRGG